MAPETSNKLVPVLGSHLHGVLKRLRSPQLAAEYPAISLSYSQHDPVGAPVVVTLGGNGLRLRFDGPEQRLRLIEVLDFGRAQVEYEGADMFKSHEAGQTGPSYRSLSKLFGPTFPGECVEDEHGRDSTTYVLSYPGVAFSFTASRAALESRKDNQALLSPSVASNANAMAVFSGESWPTARTTLFGGQTAPPTRSRAPSSPPAAAATARQPEAADDIELVRVHGEGRLELVRRSGQVLGITLGETSPQDLVAELGPPDAVYHKNDRRLAIHRNGGAGRDRSSSADTAYSSARTTEDDDDDDGEGGSADQDAADAALSAEARELATAEQFFNYNRFGLDVFISQAAAPSAAPPTLPEALTGAGERGPGGLPGGGQTATKVVMHGNVPASWLFGRHRRCRWQLAHVPTARDTRALSSEMAFTEVAARLGDVYGSGERKGMFLNRGWTESPSSSCELLGGWEEDQGAGGRARGGDGASTTHNEQGVSSTSELVGFPGMVFEVLPNDAIAALTVY